MKKYSIRCGVAFLIVLAFLTYFSSTIENILLPQVKVAQVIYGTIDGNQSSDDRYLIPVSAVTFMGEKGTVFVINTYGSNKTTVSEVPVKIENSDNFYYEVTSDDILGGVEVVYSTSKSISNGDRVHIVGEE